MPNSPSRKQLILAGYSRVERDDRLLDVFPKETPEKGVELWEKWPLGAESTKGTVEIVRIHNEHLTFHSIPLVDLEAALQRNQPLKLQDIAI